METAPMLTAWDDLSPVVLALMQAEKSLYQRLVCAPPRAFHCYAIFLRLSEDARKKSDGALAQQMYHENPLDLVRAVFPNIGPDLLRILARVEPRAWSANEYLDLEQALRTIARDALMSASRVTPSLVSKVQQLDGLPMLVGTIMPKLGYDIEKAKHFGLMFDIMQTWGVLEPEAEAAAILRKVRPDRLSHFVERRLARIKAPAFPVALPSLFRMLDTLSGVRAAGHRYANCLADHYGNWRDYITGQLRILEWSGEEPVIMAIRKYLGEIWCVEHIAGAENKPVGPETTAAIFAELRSTGLKFIDQRAASYLDWIAETTYEGRAFTDEDEKLFLDELAEC